MTVLRNDANSLARSLVWWAPEELGSLRERLDTKLASFGLAWGLELSLGALTNACEAEPRVLELPFNAWSNLAATTDRCRGIWMAGAESPLVMLRRVLFGAEDALGRTVSQDTAGSMSAQVAAKAWGALCEALGGEHPETEVVTETAFVAADFPSKQRLPWSGAITGVLTVRGATAVDLPLHLEPTRAREWIPTRANTRATAQPARALTPVFDALGRQPLRMAARLAEIDLDLKALMTLRAGDVVTVPQPLHEPTKLFLLQADQGNTCLAVGHLGAVDNAKGIQLQAVIDKTAASSKT